MISKTNIDNGNTFDWGRTSEDYAKYRDIYPDMFYKKLLDIGLCLKGQKVLDIGTGTGVLPRNLYPYGAEFTGVDISENQIKEARRLSAEAGMNISYVVSPAETIDFPAGYFDTVLACQCYVYFDKSLIFSKIHEILNKSGHFCILFMAWLPDESDIAAQSEKLILKYNPSWTGNGMKRFTYDVAAEACAFFNMEHSFCYDLPVSFTRESWHGRMKACRGIGASSLPVSKIAEFEKEHMEFLEGVPEVFDIPHFVTVLNLCKK